MSRLRVYTVHVNPSAPNPYEDARFIEEGFNWKAFFFSALWTLYKGLWLPTILILTVNSVIAYLKLNDVVSHSAFICMILAWNAIIGILANDWLREKLKRRGYIITDIVTGDSLLRAEQRFFDRYFSGNPAPAFVS